MIDDLIGSFFKQIDPRKTKVVASPSLLLVFGGPVSVGHDRLSARDVLVDEIWKHHPDIQKVVLLPEDIPQWIEFGVYRDLLAFEEDLAYLTSVVVLFCESPGAIAELGSFALIPPLAERLLLVVEREHHDADSFISLGPIRRIEHTYSNPAYVLPSLRPTDVVPHVGDLISTIQERLNAQPRTEQFQADSPKHQLLAIADFIDLFSIVRQKEIRAFLLGLGADIDQSKLDRYLFVLEKLEIIKFVKHGTDRFLAPGKGRASFLDYTSAQDAPSFNRLRTKAHVFDVLRGDRFRSSALEIAQKP